MSIKTLLKSEFDKRKKRNLRYSLRAYAKSLNVSAGRVSEIMAGKREPTPLMLKKILISLGYSENQVLSALEEHIQQSQIRKINFQLKSKGDYSPLKNEHLKVISDWPHHAILSLIETSNFRLDPFWIARRLAITPQRVVRTIRRLERVGIISFENEKIKVCTQKSTTTQDVPSKVLRKMHSERIAQAKRSLEEVEVELRDITSMSLAIDMKKLPEAKQLLREFRRHLAGFLESGNRTEVFNLNIQLVPVTKVLK